MKAYYLKEEITKVRSADGRGFSEPISHFKWCKLSKNKYLVITPKLFTKAPGDVASVVSSKKFLKLMDGLIIEAK